MRSRRTQLCMDLDVLSSLIEEEDGRSQMSYRLALFRAVIGRSDLQQISERSRRHRIACNRAWCRLIDSGNALAQAFYVQHECQPSDDYLKRTYGIHSTELAWLRKEYMALTSRYGVERVLRMDGSPLWMQRVEERRSELTVWIGDIALQDMLFAITAYAVRK